MKRLIDFFTSNPLIVKVFLIIVFIAGTASFLNLERESLPKVDFSIVIVQTIYPGASPLDVELNISKKIEGELEGVDGLDKYISTSAENFSSVAIWIDIDNKDTEKVKREIQKAVDRAAILFPAKANRPEVNELKTENVPIIRYVVSSESITEKEMREIAKNLEEKIRENKNVGQIGKIAYRDQEIKVLGDLVKMSYTNISLADISAAIRNYNIRLGGGNIDSPVKEKSIVTISEFKNIKEIEQVIIRSNFSNNNVKIKDVAVVKEGYSERDIYARGNQNNGIIIEVLKKEGKDIIDTVDAVNLIVEGYAKELAAKYQDKVKLVPVGDITKNTRKLLSASFTNAWQGVLLVFLVLILFLDFKSAFWVAFGIPFSLMIAFLGASLLGFTVNNIVLFGVIIVIGMLVDNQVVVAENIHQKREKGLTGIKAAIQGASEVFAPVAGSSLTTVAAFLPLLFLGGITGKFIYQMPIIIILALAGSLIEAFLVLPSTIRKDPKTIKKLEGRKWVYSLQKGYKKFLYQAIRFKYAIVGFFIILFIVAAFVVTKLDVILFSNKDNEIINIVYEGPEGITLDEMFKRVKQLEDAIVKEVPYNTELDSIASIIGNSAFSIIEGGRKGNKRATTRVFLIPYDYRTRTAAEIVIRIREIAKTYNLGFKDVQIREQAGGPPVGRPVEFKIISNNDLLRKQFSDQIEEFLKKQPGVFALDNDSKNVTEEIRIKLDINELYKLGVNPLVVASTIRTAYEGDTVSSIVTQDEDIHIVVSLQDQFKKEVNSLKAILIPTSYRKQIRLEQIASFPVVNSQDSILRYDGKRATTITSELNFKENTPTKIMNAVLEKFQKEVDKYPDVKLKAGGEGEQTKESFQAGVIAFLIAIVAIFLILLLEFKSITQPMLVLATLPFGFIGVSFAFYAHQEPIGFFAIIGWVGLAGVIVNNAIVLIDVVNALRRERQVANRDDLLHVIVEGTASRLRPILLTTITTVLGLIPSIYGWGGSVFIVRPVVMALGYGLLFGMFLTLILIPAFYLIDYDMKQRINKIVAFFKKKKQVLSR
jgi:multidrug efflux pump subunit AcrB